MQIDDIVHHEVHGYGLVLGVDGYDVEVRFNRVTREVHPVKLKVVHPATAALDLLGAKRLAKTAVLWLGATDPSLRSAAANALARLTDHRNVLHVERVVKGWPDLMAVPAINALAEARLAMQMPSWAAAVEAALRAEAERKATEAEQRERDAERDAARREARLAEATDRAEREELEALAVGLEDAGIPDDLHRRLLNHARQRRGELQLDVREAEQVIGRMARAGALHPRASWCWNCKRTVRNRTHEECRHCGWLACWWCGSCEIVKDGSGEPTAICRATSWARDDLSHLADCDSRGVPILTSRPPAPEAGALASLLDAAGIVRAFHWSPARSVKSILRHGLLAPQELDDRGIGFIPHFYGSRDKAALLYGYTALSFYPKFQMMRTWSDAPVLIEVDSQALLTSGALYVPGNSAASGFTASDIRAMTGLSAMQAVVSPVSGEMAPQAEAWIPKRIPRAAIKRVLVSGSSGRDELVAGSTRTPICRRPNSASWRPRSNDGARETWRLGPLRRDIVLTVLNNNLNHPLHGLVAVDEQELVEHCRTARPDEGTYQCVDERLRRQLHPGEVDGDLGPGIEQWIYLVKSDPASGVLVLGKCTRAFDDGDVHPNLARLNRSFFALRTSSWYAL